jgi:hypothetical protein
VFSTLISAQEAGSKNRNVSMLQAKRLLSLQSGVSAPFQHSEGLPSRPKGLHVPGVRRVV